MSTSSLADWTPEAVRATDVAAGGSLDGGSELLVPDIVLPCQFFRGRGYGEVASGEIALRFAILEDAIECFRRQFVSSGSTVRKLAREAERWLFRDRPGWPFSFASVCEVLGVDGRSLRRELARWRREPPTDLRQVRAHVVLARRLLGAAA